MPQVPKGPISAPLLHASNSSWYTFDGSIGKRSQGMARRKALVHDNERYSSHSSRLRILPSGTLG